MHLAAQKCVENVLRGGIIIPADPTGGNCYRNPTQDMQVKNIMNGIWRTAQ